MPPVHIPLQGAGCRLLLHWCTLTEDLYKMFCCRRLSDKGSSLHEFFLTRQAIPTLPAGVKEFALQLTELAAPEPRLAAVSEERQCAWAASFLQLALTVQRACLLQVILLPVSGAALL